jgi:hypothetical protein
LKDELEWSIKGEAYNMIKLKTSMNKFRILNPQVAPALMPKLEDLRVPGKIPNRNIPDLCQSVIY